MGTCRTTCQLTMTSTLFSQNMHLTDWGRKTEMPTSTWIHGIPTEFQWPYLPKYLLFPQAKLSWGLVFDVSALLWDYLSVVNPRLKNKQCCLLLNSAYLMCTFICALCSCQFSSLRSRSSSLDLLSSCLRSSPCFRKPSTIKSKMKFELM